MSYKYDEYLYDHRSAVKKAYDWLLEYNIIMPCLDYDDLLKHDESKNSEAEYKPYDDYFYGNKSHAVVEAFNYAWLHHIHNNPHHWQYWVLLHDDEPEEILEMPYEYIVEMICDWWSFSFRSGNLREIFDWYEKHKNMKLAPETRKTVEGILDKIKMELDKEEEDDYLEYHGIKGQKWKEGDYLEHHGIKGQKWGVKNGPPYPLKGFESANSLSEHMKSFLYKEYDKLMSPDEVGKNRTGSCHDQVMYEFQQLRRLGKEPKGLFVMEYSNNNQGGMTHSLVHYKEDGKEKWFENAWSERAGISSYNSLDDIVKEIKAAHDSGEFGNQKVYGNLIFGTFSDSDHNIGEDLQEFVDICLKKEYK